MVEQGLHDQLEPIYNSYVSLQDVAWRTCRKRLPIETGGVIGWGKSMLAVRQDGDDDRYVSLISLQTAQMQV